MILIEILFPFMTIIRGGKKDGKINIFLWYFNNEHDSCLLIFPNGYR